MVSELTERTMIGYSAGLTSRRVGARGRSVSNWALAAVAAVIAARICSKLVLMFSASSNCRMMLVDPQRTARGHLADPRYQVELILEQGGDVGGHGLGVGAGEQGADLDCWKIRVRQ